ncbi:MAG TPA: hypothetical protein VHL31_02720 [Geminicoccus sp.]|uniref:hypothetical protein n=1 Tax=Geminicoccus sp. TaxID=2024832 RepID=UPI002E379470|nr:hypothetical protein [Geminicoccus sp.]HEX2525199.1 hypothetical protein [Geminicoccus sp.]
MLMVLVGMAALGGCASSDPSVAQAQLVRQDLVFAASPVASPVLPSSSDLALVGMDAQRVDDLFGSPEIALRAGQAQWWRYPLGVCALDIFMLESTSTADMVVSHVSVRPMAGASGVGLEACRELDVQLGRTDQPVPRLPSVQIH